MKKTLILLTILLFTAPLIFAGGEQEDSAGKLPLEGQTVAVLVWPMSMLEPIHDRISEFEKMTGAEVILDPMGEEQLRQRQMTEFASKNIVHNVILVDVWTIASQEKFLMPLDDMLANSGDGWEGLHDFDYDDFDKFMKEAYEYNGKTLGIPFYWENAGLHYRRDLFDQFGVDVPETYLEYRTAAEKLTKDLDGDGQIDVYGTAQRAVRGEDSGLMSCGAAASFGTSMFEGGYNAGPDISAHKAKPQVNSKEWVDAFEFYGGILHDFAPPGVTSYSWTEVVRDFEEGKIAMDIDANYFVGMYNNPDVSKVAGNAELTLSPKGPDGDYYQHPFVCAFGIPLGAPDPEAAWEFIKWYTCKDTTGKSIEPGFRMTPCIPSLMETDTYKRMFTEEVGEKILETLDLADWTLMPVFPEADEPTFIIGDAWSNVVAGLKTPEEALNQAQDEIMAVMEEAGYYK